MPKPTLRGRFIRVGVVITLVVIIAVILVFQSQEYKILSPLKTDGFFAQQHLGITYDLDDLGVADVNNDQFLDIYTTNHSSRQKLLINNGHGKFTDQLLKFGLSTNSVFPGAEPSDKEPSIDIPGLYIYWHMRELIIRAHDISNIGPMMGKVQIPNHAVVDVKHNCEAYSKKNEDMLNVDFSCEDNGWLTLQTFRFLFDASFKLNKQVPLDRVHIGSKRLHPSSHEFILPPGIDRHGMAWADYNGDGRTDVFIIHGGGVGEMASDLLRHNDELLVKDADTFTDRAAISGIVKDVCPGRRVAWVDFDGDDRLDIYVGCGRRTPPRNLYPNQLHWQKTPGQFVNVAMERNLDIPEEGAFVWLDADNDRDMDLFWTDNKAFWLYVNQSGQFTRQFIGQSGSSVRNLTIADYDSDSDIDVFAVTEKRNILLINVGGTYQLADPQSVGLPAQSYAAQWVDYDNDGLTDLYVSPGGIYRQRLDHRFEATQILERQYARGQLFSTWFDADNDGFRDLLIAIKELPSIWTRVWWQVLKIFQTQYLFHLEKWNIVLYRNMGAKDHWVQFQLIGSEGNRPAVGAVVEVTSPDRTQRQQVGQAEGSIRSQGHYRLYFGLGQQQQGLSAKIFWPDGYVQEIKNLSIDQVLVIQREGLKISRSTGD